MKKRILSLLVSVILILQSVCMITSATPAETDNVPVIPAETQNAVDFLVKLGVLDADFDANGVATKSSFLCMALDAIKLEATSSDKQLFSDVPLNYYAADHIATAYKTGYINGNGDGTFSPDKCVNMNEALAIVMNILNYGHLAGTNSYQIVVRNQDLLKDVEKNEDGTLNNGACAVMLKNMLLAEYNMLSGVEGDAGIYETNEYTTLLYLMYSIIRDEGIVTAVDEIYLDGHNAVRQGYMALDDVVVEDAEGLANDMLGFYVELFAKEDEDAYSLFAINNSSRKNEELIIEAKDLTNKSTATKIVYKNEADKEKTIELPTDYTLIYNGRNYNGFTSSVFRLTQGKIRLVTNNGGDYTLVYVYEYENFIVKNVSYSDEKIYLENTTQVIDYGKKKEVILLDAKGEPADGSYFYAGLVVTVFKAKGSNTFKTVQAGQGDFIMKPDGVDDKYIYMGEEKIRLASSIESRLSQIKLGTKTVFALDAFGDAVDFEFVTTGTMYGYLVDIEVADDSFGEVIYGVKIFTENNKMEIFKTEEKMKLNGGTSDDSSNVISNFMSGGVCVPQLVKFVASDEGVLKELITYTDKSAEENYIGYDEDNFTLDYVTQSDSIYRSEGKLIDTRYIANGSTLLFNIPSAEESGDERNYSCKTCAGGVGASELKDDTYQLFDISKKRVASVVLVNKAGTGTEFSKTEYEEPVVVMEVSRGVNEDGEEVTVVKGYRGKEEVRYIMEDETRVERKESGTIAQFKDIAISDLHCGDVVHIKATGIENKILALKILYRRGENPAYYRYYVGDTAHVTDKDYYAWFYGASAHVTDQYDDVIIANESNGTTTLERLFPFNSSTIYYVYDSARNRVSITDMSEYMIDCDVFVTARLSSVKMVVIYK